MTIPDIRPAGEGAGLKHFGWAPGGYMGTCGSCGRERMGDKRAVNCHDCALALFLKELAGRGPIESQPTPVVKESLTADRTEAVNSRESVARQMYKEFCLGSWDAEPEWFKAQFYERVDRVLALVAVPVPVVEPAAPVVEPMTLEQIFEKHAGICPTCDHDFTNPPAAVVEQGESRGADPEALHVVIRHNPSGKSDYLPGRAGFATDAQIKAMDEAATGTGYRYSSLTSILGSFDSLVAAAQAALAYDRAISSCANEPGKMASFCTAQGDDLDTLYFNWVNASKQALAQARGGSHV